MYQELRGGSTRELLTSFFKQTNKKTGKELRFDVAAQQKAEQGLCQPPKLLWSLSSEQMRGYRFLEVV